MAPPQLNFSSIKVNMALFRIGLLWELFWGYSKWQQIQQCFRFKQKFVIEILVAEKWKLYEVYWRMCMESIFLYLFKKKKALKMG